MDALPFILEAAVGMVCVWCACGVRVVCVWCTCGVRVVYVCVFRRADAM